MKAIATANHKGGTRKTTVAVNLEYTWVILDYYLS
jgi:cellulose biosynthesis protein BcsQ